MGSVATGTAGEIRRFIWGNRVNQNKNKSIYKEEMKL
jgi:hypothetical protein